MLKIKFVNGTEVPYLEALETEEFYNGSSRRTLTFEMDAATTNVQELSDLCTENNCAVLELTNTDLEITNIYEDYILKLSCGTKMVFVVEDNSSREIVELKLGKRTFMERMVAEEAAAQDRTDAQALYTAMMTDTLLED